MSTSEAIKAAMFVFDESRRVVLKELCTQIPPGTPLARRHLYSDMLQQMEALGMVEQADTVAGAKTFVAGGDMADIPAAVSAYVAYLALGGGKDVG